VKILVDVADGTSCPVTQRMVGIGEKQTLARQVVPLATVAPVPRIDYVTPPGVTIYDVLTTYGGTVTMAAPGW